MTRSDDLSPLDVDAVKVLIAHTRTGITSCHCGWGSHAGNMGQLHSLHVWRELQRAVIADHDARVREQIAQAIEADRLPVTAPPGSAERGWQLGHNKGLADAAAIARQHTGEDT